MSPYYWGGRPFDLGGKKAKERPCGELKEKKNYPYAILFRASTKEAG